MQTVKTIPGKTYAVESAGEVIITNTETGAIAAQGDGSGQVLFTACANSYTVSDDAAKVVALFKLAPRLRLALLQGGAGGWLPKGFTELEWLESSGTQNICVQSPNLIDTGLTLYAEHDLQLISETEGSYSVIGFANRGGVSWGTSNNGFLSLAASVSIIPEAITDVPANVRNLVAFSTRYTGTGNLFYKKFTVNGGKTITLPNSGVGRIPELWKYGILSPPEDCAASRIGSWRVWRVKVEVGDLRYNLVPVLDAEGIPCMYDKVSKTCFYNVGSGTFGYRVLHQETEFAPMSLRDPYYTAPSGVYARLSGENELEVLADTEETTGDGWEWFANTAAAYKHFGIVPEMEAELLTE